MKPDTIEEAESNLQQSTQDYQYLLMAYERANTRVNIAERRMYEIKAALASAEFYVKDAIDARTKAQNKERQANAGLMLAHLRYIRAKDPENAG